MDIEKHYINSTYYYLKHVNVGMEEYFFNIIKSIFQTNSDIMLEGERSPRGSCLQKVPEKNVSSVLFNLLFKNTLFIYF